LIEELHEPRLRRAHRFVWWLNAVVLVTVAVWAASLPFGLIYTAMNDGVPLPRGHATFVTLYIWWLVGPLLALNLFWLIHALRRWRSNSTMPEPETAQHGCSGGVLLLALLTGGVLICLLPPALWLPFGMFYESFDYDDDYISGAFHEHLTHLVWAVVTLLGVINLAWMIYAICSKVRRPLPPDLAQFPTIPEGVSDRFAPPRLPQIKADEGVQGNSGEKFEGDRR
jgi:hypothetical protein